MMKMWLKLSTLLLTVAAAAVVISSEHVFLNKTRVEVLSGSSLVLHCCLNSEEHERFVITWYFSDSGSIFNQSHPLCLRRINKTAWNNTEKQEQDKTCHLPVNKVKSGWYFCRIKGDIPFLKTEISNGTEVVLSNSLVENTTYPSLVTSQQVPPTGKLPWMWIALAGSSFIVIVLLVVCFVTRKRCHQSTVEEPTYVNHIHRGKKQPSPRLPPPVNNLKAASSTQSLRTPSSARRYEDHRRPRR